PESTGVFNHDVPCGSCNICCRSGYNIYVDSEETKRFPEAILDKEEDRLMLPFAEDGKTCSKLVNEKCSIYSERPKTCRAYDCRGMFFTGLIPSPEKDQQELEDLLAHRMYTRFKTDKDETVFRILKMSGQNLAGTINSTSHDTFSKLTGLPTEAIAMLLNTPEGASILAISIAIKNYSTIEKTIQMLDSMPDDIREQLAMSLAKQGTLP
ncbi:putative zinc- or iron-chelating domain-containing protein, partial [Candidatus Electrothrix aarhusensis]